MATKVAGPYKLLVSGARSGRENMDIDLALLKDLERGVIRPTIRFYRWQPACVSLGYSQNPEHLVDAEHLKDLSWDIVKRPTGGGAAFHNTDEVSYSITARSDDQMFMGGLAASYKIISGAIISALSRLGVQAELSRAKKTVHSSVCFSYPTNHEIVSAGKKIVGSAQKRGKAAFLQHGSIFVSRIKDEVISAVNGADVKGIQNSYVSIEEMIGRKPSFDEIISALKPAFEQVLI